MALDRARGVFDGLTAEFNRRFGRGYTGQVESYRLEDADIALVASGSMCGTIKTVIDREREKGVKVGLLRLRMYRPFPGEAVVSALRGKRCVGVVDRSICFGFDPGPICLEVRSFSRELGEVKLLSFIDGIANTDITTANIEFMIRRIQDAARGESVPEVTWVCTEDVQGGK
jgi:pyruvate/2-oxoacid:ferredoxin oxidoreductase alpha subunit